MLTSDTYVVIVRLTRIRNSRRERIEVVVTDARDCAHARAAAIGATENGFKVTAVSVPQMVLKGQLR